VLRGRGAGDTLSPSSSETRRARRRLRQHLLIYLGLAPFVVIAIFPVYWMAITAFKEDADLYRMDLVPFWFHMAPTLAHFRLLFQHTYFSVWFLNTMSLSICLVLVTLATAVPAAYALARSDDPGGRRGNLADPRRHFLLGLADGGGAAGRPARGHPVHRVPRSLHPRPHRDRRELTRPDRRCDDAALAPRSSGR
jgi:hypothetical protein